MLIGLSLGTAVSFAKKLLPLLKPEKRGTLGGLPFLAGGVVAVGIYSFFLFPELLQPSPWLEATFVVLFGYAVYRFALTKPVKIPRLKTDWTIFSILACTFILSLAVLFI